MLVSMCTLYVVLRIHVHVYGHALLQNMQNALCLPNIDQKTCARNNTHDLVQLTSSDHMQSFHDQQKLPNINVLQVNLIKIQAFWKG